ncbi:MAG: hypothetical protein AAGJ81_01205 [Verrucomicrobiota bacterium]
MPNQLARSKIRKTVAEHVAVLKMLELIAKRESKTSTDLLREATRDLIRDHARDEDFASRLLQVYCAFAPRLPSRIQKPSDLVRFKKECREFDDIAVDLGLREALDIQERNSVHGISEPPVLISQL